MNSDTSLRDVVLAGDTEIAEVPLREFSLKAFGTAEVFSLLRPEPGDGIERISINLIKVAKPFDQEDENGIWATSVSATAMPSRRCSSRDGSRMRQPSRSPRPCPTRRSARVAWC